MQGRVLDLEPYIDTARNALGWQFNATIGEDCVVRGPFYYAVVMPTPISDMDSEAQKNRLLEVLEQFKRECAQQPCAQMITDMGEDIIL